MENEINGYGLSRSWFDFCFENPELINPNHTAIFFFAIEHCNRLGWKKKFGFPTQMAMDALGIKKHATYIRYFNDLCNWGFFKLIQKSQNQYSSNIICLSSALPKNGKALDKAIVKHEAKHGNSTGQSNGKSNGSINKPLTINNINQEQGNGPDENFDVENFLENFPGCPAPETEEKPIGHILMQQFIEINPGYTSRTAKDMVAIVGIVDTILQDRGIKNDFYHLQPPDREILLPAWKQLCEWYRDAGEVEDLSYIERFKIQKILNELKNGKRKTSGFNRGNTQEKLYGSNERQDTYAKGF